MTLRDVSIIHEKVGHTMVIGHIVMSATKPYNVIMSVVNDLVMEGIAGTERCAQNSHPI